MKGKIKLGFFKGVNFSNTIGTADWRIGFHMPDFGFATWIYGQGKCPAIHKHDLFFISAPFIRIPIIHTIFCSIYYVIKANKKDFDAVICGPWLFWSGLLYRLLHPNAKLILDIRSTPVETRGLLGLINKLNFYLVMRSKAYDAISVVTKWMLEELDEQYHFIDQKQYAIWNNGYDDVFHPFQKLPEADQLHDQHGIFNVMFHGSLTMNRGLFEAIQAIYLLENMGIRDVRLSLIGQGEAERSLRRLSKNLGITDRVSFFPPVSYDEIPKLISLADLGIDPLPDHPWWRYQFAVKVIEYLAMGKPVIATDIPCHTGISESVILIPDNTPEQIASAIIRYRKKTEVEKLRMQQTALNDVKNATWHDRAKLLADFIRHEVLET